MRFTKAEGHFITKDQALAEIASVGWHAIEMTFSAEEELHWHDFDAVAYVLEGTARRIGFSNALFLPHGAPNTALDACESVFEGVFEGG